MSEPRRIDRRRFLYAALGAGSAVAFAGLKPWRAVVAISSQPLEARLGALLDHRSSALVVGREYLRASRAKGERPDAQALADAIAADLPPQARSASGTELRELVADGVRRDFDVGLTVRLRGWIVSRTEARLCALAVQDGAAGVRARRASTRSRAGAGGLLG